MFAAMSGEVRRVEVRRGRVGESSEGDMRGYDMGGTRE